MHAVFVLLRWKLLAIFESRNILGYILVKCTVTLRAHYKRPQEGPWAILWKIFEILDI